MIEVAGAIAGNDRTYNELVERLSAFCRKAYERSRRRACQLLKQAQQLDFEKDRIDVIRLLGKAVIGLSKKEHSEQQIEALHLLMITYRGAGLLWAARATCVMAAASIVIAGEEDNDLPVSLCQR